MPDPDAVLIQDATAETLSDNHPLADEKPSRQAAAAEVDEAAPAGPSVAELRARAAELEIEGRSSMNKAELEAAIEAAEEASEDDEDDD